MSPDRQARMMLSEKTGDRRRCAVPGSLGNGFSLTMYGSDGFFVANPLDRVNLSQRSNLNFNEDGSL
jgi:hypothetical protein